MPILYKRTGSDDPDFLSLVAGLDADLAIRDGDEHVFYAQLNKTDNLPTCIVAYEDDQPVATGALRPIDEAGIEVKRMYVIPSKRGLGIASGMLGELERWAVELGYPVTLLETGHKQPEAIALYKKNGYQVIPNFGKYWSVDNSICFKKELKG